MIEIKELFIQDINDHILDNINRYQKVIKHWTNKNGNWELINEEYVVDWDKENKQRKIQQFTSILENKTGHFFGAFYENKLIGFSVLLNERFGSNNQYIQLKFLYVSNDYRYKGIGKRLFQLCVEKAKRMDVEKIYICANDSEETQKFYLNIGCKDAEEIIQKLYNEKRYDRHIEYKVN
jgi:N-acetylglutamate synthase-like GNAT family acetyltransferase